MPPKDKKDDKSVQIQAGDDDKKKDDKLKKEPPTLSEEDRELKERLETCVETVADSKAATEVRLQALTVMATELQTATSSMTSVPKPLKFLRPHYGTLQGEYEGITANSKALAGPLADILSVLAMTMGTKEGESLKYKLQAYTHHGKVDDEKDSLGIWGHEYVRSLAGEIGTEYARRVTTDEADPDDDSKFADLLRMTDVIVKFHVAHNAEAEAVDLLIEVQRLKKLLSLQAIDDNNYSRICLYLLKTADYMSDPEDWLEMLETAYEIFRQQKQHFDALRVALRMQNTECIGTLLAECDDVLVKKQMCYLLGRHRVNYEVDDEMDEAETLNEIIGNQKLSEFFLKLAQDLDVVDAKTPEDIYKSHLAETGGFRSRGGRGTDQQVDSARANLASTFVNAFVNAGFGQDKLMTPASSDWLYKNKDHGMMSAAASLGSIMLWNVEEGLTQVDKFLYSSEDNIKAGAFLAIGILSSGVRDEADPALALLSQYFEEENSPHVLKCAAATGLGIAYAGSAREEVMEILLPVVESSGGGPAGMTEVCLSGLALGMIFVGKCDEMVGGTIVQRLMEASDEELDHVHARYLCLGLALLFLGQLEKAEAMIEALRTIEHKISKYAVLMLETAAYAGSGNVLKVQEMLHHCAEHLTEDAEHQMAAVLGIGLITMGEDVGAEMALRTFDHLLHYCELPIKRAVPLTLAILNISNPDYSVIDQLSRLSHDPDAEISQNAIIGLGLASAGTNNSRVAGLLRQLGEFYSKEAGHIFCVRIAQGLLHMGKGLMTINPFHSDRSLLNGPALGGILVLLHSCLDLKNTLLDKSHYLLYYLTCAMNPRMLLTVDEDDNMKPVTVRVGQAVETVGQAGKPKRITGFQTHSTPVLLSSIERAELGTEEVLAVSSVLEGVVIVKDNPDYDPEESK